MADPNYEKIAEEYLKACESLQDRDAEKVLLVHQLRTMYEAGKLEGTKQAGG